MDDANERDKSNLAMPVRKALANRPAWIQGQFAVPEELPQLPVQCSWEKES